MRHEMNGIQMKYHNVGLYRINKFSFSYDKSICLKMDIGYHIFRNVFVNHIKKNFIKYKQSFFIFHSSCNSDFVHNFSLL